MTTYIAVSIAAVMCLGDAVYDWYYDIPAPALPFDTPVP